MRADSVRKWWGLLGTVVVVGCGSTAPEPTPDAGPTVFARCDAVGTTSLCTEFVSDFFAGSFTQGLAQQNCEEKFQGAFQVNAACGHAAAVPGYCQIDDFQNAAGATVHRYFYPAAYSADSAKAACETTDLGRGTWHAG